MKTRHALVLAGTTLGLLMWSPAAWAETLARLIEASGDVTVQTGAVVRPAPVGTTLEAGDAVRTGARSTATLERQDGTTVELLPFSELVIENERGFWLRAGRLWSHFMKAVGDPFFIRTPNATALIRGTTLGVEYADERSGVVVVEGLVEVQGKEGRMDVPAGFRIQVDRSGRLERLERAEAREQEDGRMFRMRRGLEGGARSPLDPGTGLPTPANGLRPGQPDGLRQIQGQPGDPPGADDRRIPGERRGPEERRGAPRPGPRLLPTFERQVEAGPRMEQAEAGQQARAAMLEKRERLVRRLRQLEEARAKQGSGGPTPNQEAQEQAVQRMLRLERRP